MQQVTEIKHYISILLRDREYGSELCDIDELVKEDLICGVGIEHLDGSQYRLKINLVKALPDRYIPDSVQDIPIRYEVTGIARASNEEK